MMKSKIIFCLISTLLISSCGKKEGSKVKSHSSSIELFESLIPEFHYYTEGASLLNLDANGFLHSTKVEKKLLLYPGTKKCRYYEDIVTPIKAQFQSLDLKDYFDFYIDEIKLESFVLVNGNYMFNLPENSFKFEMKLKPHLHGKKTLKRYEAVKPKYCRGATGQRIEGFNITTPLVKYESFAEIEKLIEINYKIKISKSFIP